jgi:hypothetical protein
MNRRALTIAVLLPFLFACKATAHAGQFTVGVNVNAGVGVHQESGNQNASTGFATAPFIDAAYRTGPWQIHAEGTPSITGTFNANALGLHSVRLSYDEAALRYWFPGTVFAIGVGGTLWNQRSISYITSSLYQVSASRGSGLRYEAVAALPLGSRHRLDLSFADSPSMRATLAFMLDDRTLPLLSVPEYGALVDARAQDVISFASGDFYYGVRYIHLTMDYDRNILADRDLIWAGFAGWSWRFGHS